MPYLCVFHSIWVLGGGGGGSRKGLVHNLLMQFFTVASSKIEVFETFFPNCDHLRCLSKVCKAIFSPVFVYFLPYFGYVLLGVDSLRGGLAKGNRITLQRVLDQSKAGI